MGHRWQTDVPPPIFVSTDEEAYALLHLLEMKMELYPDEVIAIDTETHGLKVPIKHRWDEQGKWDDNPKYAGKDPLDWMRDTVDFWSLAARMDRKTQPYWEAYLRRFHPDYEMTEYARWCLQVEQLFIFTPLLENPKTKLGTWNGKYDAHVLWNSGVDVMQADVYDYLTAALILDENDQGRNSLKDQGPKFLKLPMIKFRDLFDLDINGEKAVEFVTPLRMLPLESVVHYASYDAYITLKVGEVLEERLRLEKIPVPGEDISLWDHFVWTEVPFTKVLWWMERRGMYVDVDRLVALEPPIEAELLKISKEICNIAGDYINLNSPKQLVKYFFGEMKPDGTWDGKYQPIRMTTRGGDTPSTDVDVLEILMAHGDPVAKLIMRHRKISKILSTYIRAQHAMAYHHADHRIHPNFNQYGARTGRLSTTAPNSQNMPRPDTDEFGIRTMFTAPPGYKLIIGDYEQLEMRIMAHFCQDPTMLDGIRSGLDLHCFTVSIMHNVPYEEVVAAKKMKEAIKTGKAPKEALTERMKWLVAQRQAAKTIGFGLIYGAGAQSTAVELDITEDEAEEKIRLYFRTFPFVEKFIRATHNRCRRERYVMTLAGRRRRLYDISSGNPHIRGLSQRESVNSIIQGSAADIAKKAMLAIEFDPQLIELGTLIVNQVHDEIMIQIPEQNAELALPIVKHHMEFPFMGEQPLCVPTPADVHITSNWAEK